MRAWVDYIRSIDESSGGRRLWTEGFHFGDWLALDAMIPIRARAARLTILSHRPSIVIRRGWWRQAAAVLGKTEHGGGLWQPSRGSRRPFRRNTSPRPDGWPSPPRRPCRLAVHGPGAARCAPRAGEEDLIARLQRIISICGRVLSAHPISAGCFRISGPTTWPTDCCSTRITHRGCTPSTWARRPSGSGGTPSTPMARSATGMNSLNHYAYGSIVEWMYRNVAGCTHPRRCPASAARWLAPQPDPGPEVAPRQPRVGRRGRYESEWAIHDDGGLTFHFRCHSMPLPRFVPPIRD